MAEYHLYLVDDGSTDGSQAICLQYAKEHSEIMVIAQANAGPSAARNAALAIAKEEYVTFLDADDEIEPGTFEKNLKWLVGHPEVDALIFPVQSVHFDSSVSQKVSYDGLSVLDKGEAWEKWCRGDTSLPGFFWGKIYRSRLFEGLRIPQHLRFAEDMYLLSDLLSRANNVCLSPYGNYQYYERENAATQTPWTASKASNIGEAYFHRWEVATKNHLSDTGAINAWRLALAEIVAERRRFPDILQAEHRELKLHSPSLWKLLRLGFSLKQIAGVLWNIWR